MSFSGHQRTSPQSTQCPLWAKSRHRGELRECPLYPQKRTLSRLFDHLVGDGDQTGQEGKTECLRGHKIDHKLELVWLHYWQVGGFGTLEDFSCVYTHLVTRLNEAGSVAHQASVHGKLAKEVDRRYCMTRCQCD